MLALAFALLPTQLAFQNLGALLAHQPGVTARAHRFLLDSPFGTIHAATFSMPSPIGTNIPHPPVYALADFDPLDVAASIGAQLLGDPNAPLQFPKPNRKDKGDLAISRPRKPLPPLPPLLAINPIPQAAAEALFVTDDPAGRFDPYTQYEFASMPVEPEVHPAGTTAPTRKPTKDAARVYFEGVPLAATHEAIKAYAPGAAPVVRSAKISGDPDIKLAALNASAGSDNEKGGVSIAVKGEAAGTSHGPMSPAERLGLAGKTRQRAEKCLANAVYFEARGEPVRGQIAVAQVVMNRVFSSFYPSDVCGVVYQNANRHLACQFTFACDGIPDVVTNPDAWARAKRIARDMLDGKLWMPEVAKSTHYHAYWVHPDWINEMRRIYRLGAHTFYRPRAWGDGSDEPSWGDPKTTAKETKEINKL